MKNLLFISIAFPPKSDPECLQTAKYFKYLVQSKNLSISVLTSKSPTLFMPVDDQLKKYVKRYKEIIEIPIYENKYFSYLVRKLGFNLMDKPDSKFTFFRQWKKVLNRLSVKPDIIYSRSFPLSSALMALKIKKKLNVPWMMHLSDPWADSPLHNYSPKVLQWHNSMEKKCMEEANLISFTSEKTLEFYREKYPILVDKFVVLPNVYDEEDAINTLWKWNNKLRIIYTGGLINDRSPQALFNALEMLKRKHSTVLDKVEFIFAGQMDRKNVRLFEKNTYVCVKHIGLLSYQNALKLQQEANMLLLIDNPIENQKHAMFFPSKLLDYMLAKKRILAITSKGSSTYEVLKNSLSECISHSNTEGIAQAIINAVEAYKSKEYYYFNTNYLDEKYSAAYNSQQLEKLIGGL